MEVCYINLQTVDENFRTVRNFAQISADFCKKHEHKIWVNYTGCLNNIRQTERQIEEVNDLQLIPRPLTRNEDELTHTRNKEACLILLEE